MPPLVIPAKAGIHPPSIKMDSRLRGNDGVGVSGLSQKTPQPPMPFSFKNASIASMHASGFSICSMWPVSGIAS
jgi:hypothetical protein